MSLLAMKTLRTVNLTLFFFTVGRTAQVSAVPRTKVKVSGGTQTCTQDLQIHSKYAFVYNNAVESRRCVILVYYYNTFPQ